MRRNKIILADILVCLLLIAWCRFGPWIEWMGYDVYFSRAGEWLAMPVVAINFFRGMVTTGAAFFAILFLFESLLLFLRGRRLHSPAQGGLLYNAFYGGTAKLAVKYFVLLFSIGLSPYFYHSIWQYRGNRSFCIATGFIATLIMFIMLMIIGNLVIGRNTPERMSRPRL